MTAAVLGEVRLVVSSPEDSHRNGQVTGSRGQRSSCWSTDSHSVVGGHEMLIPYRRAWVGSYSRAPWAISPNVRWYVTSRSGRIHSSSRSESRTTAWERALTLQRLSA
jgi:hypothetical protein